jgi:autotransporter passenger strand-loop-strand repeat protein
LIAGAEAVFGQTLLANVRNSGLEYVASGGVANTANVGSGGMMDVTAGGAASGTVVSSGGTLLVFGTASATVLSNGAGAYVESGGTTTGTVVQNGAADIVLVGAIARGTILGGVEVVSGVTTGALINSGGLEYVVSGGIARAALISGGTLELTSGGSTGSGAVTFAVSGGGTLQLDDSLHFNGLVAGFGQPDMLYLKDLTFSAGTTSASWTQSGTSGTLAVTNGTQTTDITLLGIYSTANFHVFSGGTGGTVVTDPPVVAQADLLANPHTT